MVACKSGIGFFGAENRQKLYFPYFIWGAKSW